MHELTIVEALLSSVQQELHSRPGASVRTVRVCIGSLRLVEPEALRFCYEAAVQDTPLAGSRLEIQSIDAAARCDVCSLEFPVGDSWFECPRCHSISAQLLRGDELTLASLEIQQPVLSHVNRTQHHHAISHS